MTNPGEVKACCATAYSSDLVALLLGDSYHPGGLTLTRRLTAAMALSGGQSVLDVASGRGTSALTIAHQYDVTVTGVDLSPANVALSNGAAQAGGLSDRVGFQLGDAEKLPVPDESVDAVLCECALCTFPGKPAAAREFARVLRPGGRVGITDVTADRDLLPPELTTLAAWIACVADARPATEYADILADAGLRVTQIEHHDATIGRMIDQIEARLQFLRLTSRPKLEAYGVDLDRTEPVLGAARAAVADGILGYALLVADKPA
ncbi:methyltransferase family protein [Kribbella sp. VKM Ac-2527]|uniref:Methyltransferase family protein n=1 Tax=Kribbella caucasensis TaxID=2512215 RepID=A0A4R6J4U5_9ACTN|nr:methyltransferase domain-containing protein [Kribbella sp. VKM Ac-2527]TDO30420.1 methyltransferase family protein [Kribbella sp. VKM Ac-2527]